MKDGVIVIPVKKHSTGFEHKNRILIDRCLEEVLKTEYQVYVAGDDTWLFRVLEEKYGSKVKTVEIPTPGDYADVTDSLRKWQRITGYEGNMALVQCTSPMMKAGWIDKCFEALEHATIGATACELGFKPTALFSEENGLYVPFAKDRPAASVARQLLPHTVRITGAVEAFHTRCLECGSFWQAGPIKPVIIDERDSLDIDSKEDLRKMR